MLLIVPSEYVRAELGERFGVPAERMRAIPPGVDSRFGSPGEPAPLLARLGLDGRPYVLAWAPRARGRTSGCWTRSRRGSPQGPRCGDGRLQAGVHAPGTGIARRLGYVADADLPALYAGAAALAMPSLYEGFGLPCVEAMAAGTPVVAADRAALPEACGGAALLADPGDTGAFTAALVRARVPSAIGWSTPAEGRPRSSPGAERPRRSTRRSSRCSPRASVLADAGSALLAALQPARAPLVGAQRGLRLKTW